jgi:hypothetical protein
MEWSDHRVKVMISRAADISLTPAWWAACFCDVPQMRYAGLGLVGAKQQGAFGE